MYHIDRGAWAEINLDAVAHNVQIAKSNLDPILSCVPLSRLMLTDMAR